MQLEQKDESDRSLELLLAPPLNSHKINSAIDDEMQRPIEYFLSSDNSFVIRVIVKSALKYNISLCSQTGFEYDSKVIENNNAQTGNYDISRNGKYFAHITLENLKYHSRVIEIGKKKANDSHNQNLPDTGESKSAGNDPNEMGHKNKFNDAHSRSTSNISPKLDIIEHKKMDYDYEIKLKEENNFEIDRNQFLKWKVTNKGHLIGISLRQQKFFIDSVE